MTEFRVSGMRALEGELDSACHSINTTILGVLQGASTWPEPSISEEPANMYAIWARAWRDEITAVQDQLSAISSGLSNLAQILEQVDKNFADALSPSGR